MARTVQHPWLRHEWKILPTKLGYCCARYFECEDKNVDKNYYRVGLVEPCHRLGEVARRSSWAIEPIVLCLNNTNVQNQGTDCALVLMTIAWRPESEHPFYPQVGKFCENCFRIKLQFLLKDTTEQMQAMRSVCSRAFWLIHTSPLHTIILGRIYCFLDHKDRFWGVRAISSYRSTFWWVNCVSLEV